AAARRAKLRLAPKDAVALIEHIGEDVGEVPKRPDITKTKSYKEYEKIADAYSRLETADLERKATLDPLRALANPAAPKAKPSKPPAKKKFVMKKPPLDEVKLDDDKGREELLDVIGTWIVDGLDGASDDDARAVLAGAICAFSDVREAAGQERGEYAGHFFMV